MVSAAELGTLPPTKRSPCSAPMSGARGESVVAKMDITRVPEAGVPVLAGPVAVPSAACSAPRIPALWTARWARTASAEVLPPEYGSRETQVNGGVAAAKIAGPLGVPGFGRKVRTMPSMIRSARPYSPGPEAHAAATGRDPVRLGTCADLPLTPTRARPGEATSAITLSIWHSRQRFCPTCGAAVRPALAGWAQRCTNEADGNRVLFPRVEPAVITAIVDGHTVCCCNTTRHGRIRGCIRCPPDLWRRGRT